MWSINASSQTSVTENTEKICESKTIINPHLFHRDGSSSCKSILISSNTFCALSSSSSAYKHIQLHLNMTRSSIILLTHKALAVEIDLPEHSQSNMMNCFTYPVWFVIYLAQKCKEFHFILPLSNQARTRFLSVLAWQDNIERQRIKILASFSYGVSPDSWRGWFEPRYGRTGSPEPNLGRPSPARKPAIYRRSEKNQK